MKNNLIKYAGTKIKYVDLINEYINNTEGRIYVEPFLGSGSVFLNLEKEFDRYILNDKDRNVIRIFKSFKDADYELFKACENTILEKFGDIKKNKEDYYNFRNTFNKKIYLSDDITEGIYLYFLYNSCINSMARFGPNGFNQSFGNRYRSLTEEQFNSINKRLQKAEFYNMDFFDLDIPNNSVLFLDPPYFYKQTKNYEIISEDWFNRFIEYINESKNEIIYTDVNHNKIDWERVSIRTMQNISPNRKQEYTLDEMLYTNNINK